MYKQDPYTSLLYFDKVAAFPLPYRSFSQRLYGNFYTIMQKAVLPFSQTGFGTSFCNQIYYIPMHHFDAVDASTNYSNNQWLKEHV